MSISSSPFRQQGTLRQRGLALLLALALILSQSLSAFAAQPAPFEQNSSDKGSDKGADAGAPGLGSAEGQTEMPDAADAINTLEDARQAVVQIEAVGKFVDPSEGQMIAGGYGSGFIISPDGLAVTNNHVVTGGAIFKVSIAGEEEPRNARVLGVSECSDLAVIDIQGDGFPYLAWYDGKIKVGLDIYALGFPLGDPEYTMTRGIVSKEKASGESNWASVDQVLQHDANIDHGSSGGPLVDEEGRVVGINYAGESSSNQFFAISRDEALPVLEMLMAGRDLDSIGINGQAVVFDESLSGIFISSVASGSPADASGVLPGDILIELEGIPMGIDGLMKEYCDVLRSHSAEDVLAVKVFRSSSGEILEGQINGRQLTPSFSVAEQVGAEEGGAAATGSGETPAYDEYTTISDSSGLLSLEAPAAWEEVGEAPWRIEDKEVGLSLSASPDLKSFAESWGMPGVVFNYSTDLVGEASPEDLLGLYDYSKSCKSEGEIEALPDDSYFNGAFKSWEKCGEEATSGALLVAVTPKQSEDYLVLLEVYVASDADLEAMDHILDSFVVAGENSQAANGEQGDLAGATLTADDLLAAIDAGNLGNEYSLVQNDDVYALAPSAWDDSLTEDWTNDDGSETYGLKLTVSTNVDDYKNTWDTPGFALRSAVELDEPLDIDEWLDDIDLSKECAKKGKRSEQSYELFGQSYAGKYDTYSNCGKKKNTYLLYAANSDNGDFIYLDFLAMNKADLEAFDVLLQSIVFTAGAQGESRVAQLSEISDDTGQITIAVPETWSDSISEPWVSDDKELGVSFTASPNVKAFNDSWETPGIFVGIAPDYAPQFDVKDILDLMDFKDNCTYQDRYEYSDVQLVGQIDVWLDCNEQAGAQLSVLAASPNDEPSKLVLAWMFAPTSDDILDFSEVLAPLSAGGIQSSGDSSESSSDSAAAEEPQQAEEVTTATVVAAQLNLREGPGTNYKRLTSVKKDDVLGVAGQVNNCAWLYVVTPNADIGWVAGGAQYVKLDGDCADLPDASSLAPAAPSGNSGAASNRSPNAKKGCIQFQNNIGLDATVTFTNQDNGKAETFTVAKKAVNDHCFDPGRYTYTIDVPPPYDSINGEARLAAGDYYSFPIQSE
jgi:serine protease Do